MLKNIIISFFILISAVCVEASSALEDSMEKHKSEVKVLLVRDFQIEHGRLVIQNIYTQDAVDSADRIFYALSGQEQAKDLYSIFQGLRKEHYQIRKSIIQLNQDYNQLYPLVFGVPKIIAIKKTMEGYIKNYRGNKDILKEANRMLQDVRELTMKSKTVEKKIFAALEKLGLKNLSDCFYSDVKEKPVKRQLPRIEIGAKGEVDKIVFSGFAGRGHYRHSRDRFNFTLPHLFDYDVAHFFYIRPRWESENTDPIFDSKTQFERNYNRLSLAEWGYSAGTITPYSPSLPYTIPRWFINKAKKNNDTTIYMEFNRRGGKAGGWSINYTNPKVEEVVMRYLDALGKRYKGDKRIASYKGAWEYSDTSTAYTLHGQVKFREYLKVKYGSIKDLNNIWKSEYKSWEEIKAPEPPHKKTRKKATPLICEFECFRKKNYANWLTKCYRRLKKADPTHPIVIDASSYKLFNNPLGYGHDFWASSKDSCDVISLHSGRGDTIDHPYFYSLSRYFKKPIYNHEYTGWNGPEGWLNASEDAQEAAAYRNIWGGVGYGIRLFEIYGETDPYSVGGKPASRGNLLDYNSEYTIMRPLAGVIPMLSEKINRDKDVWFQTKVIDPQIGLFQPSTSCYACIPVDAVNFIGHEMHKVLYKKGYHYAVVFEEAFLEGKDKLENYKVIILPYATNLPRGMNRKILKYIKSGGTVIAAAPFGVYDELGFEDGEILKKIFKGVDFKYSGSRYQWEAAGEVDKYSIANESPHPNFPWITVKGSGLLAAAYGKGKVFLALDGVDLTGNLLNNFYQAIDGSSSQIVWSTDAPLHFILRKGKAGIYLLVRNLYSNKEVKTNIYINGLFDIEDMFLKGINIPVKHTDGLTVIPVYLQPGRAVLYRLSGARLQYPDNERAKEILYLKAKQHLEDLCLPDTPSFRNGLKLLKNLKRCLKGKSQYETAKMASEYFYQIKSASLKSRVDKAKEKETGLPEYEQARRKLWAEYIHWLGDAEVGSAGALDEANQEMADYNNLTDVVKPSEKNAMAGKRRMPIRIDGEMDEWKEYNFIEIWKDVRFKVCYDKNALYFAIQVDNAKFFNDKSGKMVWCGDSVEIFLDMLNCKRGKFHFDDYHYMIGINGKSYVVNSRREQEPIEVKTASKKAGSGYVMEVAIGNEGTELPVVEGYIIGFEIRVIFSNGKGGFQSGKTISWAGSINPHLSTIDWGTLELR